MINISIGGMSVPIEKASEAWINQMLQEARKRDCRCALKSTCKYPTQTWLWQHQVVGEGLAVVAHQTVSSSAYWTLGLVGDLRKVCSIPASSARSSVILGASFSMGMQSARKPLLSLSQNKQGECDRP